MKTALTQSISWGLALLLVSFSPFSGFVPEVAFAEDGNDLPSLAEIHGYGDQVSSVSLSRDGKHIVYLEEPANGGQRVMLLGAELAHPAATIFKAESEFIKTVFWSGPSRLIAQLWSDSRSQLQGGQAPKVRMIAFDLDGSNVKALAVEAIRERDKYWRSALVHSLPEDDDHILVTAPVGRGRSNHVFRLNTRTGERTTVVKAPQEKIYDWYADHNGIVRLGHGTNKKREGHLIIRAGESDSWRNLEEQELFADDRFSVYDFTNDPNILLVSSSYATGRSALYRFDLSRGRLAGTIYRHDKYDVSGVIYSTAQDKALAAVYLADDTVIEPLDNGYKAFRAKLQAHFKAPAYLVDSNEDESLYLALETGEGVHGQYYLWEPKTDTVRPLFSTSPHKVLDYHHPVEKITYMSRDGIDIEGYLTRPTGLKDTKNLPLILLPHGGPHARDLNNRDYWAQYLASLGYAVFQPNFRGSTGFGWRFFALGWGEWGADMHNDLEDAVDALVGRGLVDQKRVCIMGGSYGGYAALWAIHKNPDMFRCSISWAGISDIKKLMKDEKFYNTEDSRYSQIMGGEKKGKIAKRSPITFVKNIKRPVLLGHGAKDDIVDISQTDVFVKAMRKRKKQVEVIRFEKEDHFLFRRDTRTRWFEKVAEFLAKHNPA